MPDLVDAARAGIAALADPGRPAAGALRQYARTDPDRVLDFVGDHADAMSGLTRREATKHLTTG